jgi:hypothetical protein
LLLVAVGALLIGLPKAGIADDSGSGPDFTFGAAVSYVYDINDPDAGNAGLNSLFYSNMESQDESFNIDLVQIGVSGERGALSYSATVDFGDLAAFAGDAADGDIGLQTANIVWDFGPAAAMAGRFATPIGLEVLEPWGNPHISRSWGWQAQPINHDGIGLSGSADIIDWSLAVANGFYVSDYPTPTNPAGWNDPDDEKAIMGSLGAALSDELNVYIAGIYSEDFDTVKRTMGNLILSGNADAGDAAVRYALEGNYRNDDSDAPAIFFDGDFWNIAGYAGTDLGPAGVDVRVDYTDDEGLVTGAPMEAKIWSITLTGSIPLGAGVDARLEYRHDDSDEDIFGDGSSLDDTLDTIQAQLVWHPETD